MSDFILELAKRLNNNGKKLVKIGEANTNLALVNTDTGEVNDNVKIELKKERFIDNDTFVKYFKNNIRLSEANLTHVSCLIIFYIMENLKTNDNLIELNPKFLKQHFKLLSLNPIYRALKQLSELKIINKVKKDYYEVNPMILFNGDRFTFIKKKVIITPEGYKITEYYQLKGNKV